MLYPFAGTCPSITYSLLKRWLSLWMRQSSEPIAIPTHNAIIYRLHLHILQLFVGLWCFMRQLLRALRAKFCDVGSRKRLHLQSIPYHVLIPLLVACCLFLSPFDKTGRKSFEIAETEPTLTSNAIESSWRYLWRLPTPKFPQHFYSMVHPWVSMRLTSLARFGTRWLLLARKCLSCASTLRPNTHVFLYLLHYVFAIFSASISASFGFSSAFLNVQRSR